METKVREMEQDIKMINTKRFALRLEQHLFDRLEQRSQEEHRSLNQQICYILERYLV